MQPLALYGHSLALLTDLYELTMAYGYWKKGMENIEAVFHLFFRKPPFNGPFALAAGLEPAMEFIRRFRYDNSDLSYLEGLKTPTGKPLFEKPFLDYLGKFSFTIDLDAVPEGTAAFPQEPLLRVQGPIIHAQLLESPLLNIINFQTLIATKSARICFAAKPHPVIEFGLRRAQGIDGAISAARAAYIGGCSSTSNVLAGKIFGIPVVGTHAHSWIMAFENEEESFEAFADLVPDNVIFLVDTYNTMEGVKKAIRVAKKMRQHGSEMIGIRMDSGDLAHLSIDIRQLLDKEGFPQAKIMASNELDEELISDLKHQGAKIDLWAVGTHLVTGKDQPALDGVYKLSAIRKKGGRWVNKLKISENLMKVTNPGILQVRRYYNEKGNAADMIYDLSSPLPETCVAVDLRDSHKVLKISPHLRHRDLLIPIFKEGKLVYSFPTLAAIRAHAQEELAAFHPAMRRFLNPQPYLTGLERSLHELKLSMIAEIQNTTS